MFSSAKAKKGHTEVIVSFHQYASLVVLRERWWTVCIFDSLFPFVYVCSNSVDAGEPGRKPWKDSLMTHLYFFQKWFYDEGTHFFFLVPIHCAFFIITKSGYVCNGSSNGYNTQYILFSFMQFHLRLPPPQTRLIINLMLMERARTKNIWEERIISLNFLT